MTDYGKRPYASNAKTYGEYMLEITEQQKRSQGYTIRPDLKQPYLHDDYTEMNYLFAGIKKTNEEDIPDVVATVVSPFFDLLDLFTDEDSNIIATPVLVEEFLTDTGWIHGSIIGTPNIFEISPASELHVYVIGAFE